MINAAQVNMREGETEERAQIRMLQEHIKSQKHVINHLNNKMQILTNEKEGEKIDAQTKQDYDLQMEELQHQLNQQQELNKKQMEKFENEKTKSLRLQKALTETESELVDLTQGKEDLERRWTVLEPSAGFAIHGRELKLFII